MEQVLELKSGFMSVHHKGLLGGNNWNKKWCILKSGSSESRACLFKCDSKEETKHPKILDLHKLSKVEKYKDSNKVFELVTKSDRHFFKCENEIEQGSWIEAFEQILHSRDRCSKASTFSEEVIIEDNLLYNSVDDSPIFKVKVDENEDSNRIGLNVNTDYYLAVFLSYIALLDSNKRQLIQWSYEHIKSFGRLHNIFLINAGRRTSTGRGSFSFKTTEVDLIHESVSKKTKTLKSYNSSDSINTAHSSLQSSKNEPSKLLNPSNLMKSMSLDGERTSPEPKEEKSRLSKSINNEKPKSAIVSNDSLKKNLEQNLQQVLIKQHSLGEDTDRPVFKGNTESQVDSKSLKKEKEKEKKEREKKQKEEQKRAKEEAKKQEKEKKVREKEMKKNKGINPRPLSQSHLYDDPVNTYEEVDDVRRPSIDEAGAYALPQDNIPTSKRAVENHYADPNEEKGTKKSTGNSNMYDTTEERSEAWRVFGNQTDNLHEEDYQNIKIAAKNPSFIENDYDMPEELYPNTPSIPADVEDETYEHITSFNFKPTRISRPDGVESENIYGDNSGTKIDTRRPDSSSEYEEASIVEVKSLQK